MLNVAHHGWVTMKMFHSRIAKTGLKANQQISKKQCFMWSSMSIFSFAEYTLTELFRKSDNWQQIYKQRVQLFKHQMMCQEEKTVSTS